MGLGRGRMREQVVPSHRGASSHCVGPGIVPQKTFGQNITFWFVLGKKCADYWGSEI